MKRLLILKLLMENLLLLDLQLKKLMGRINIGDNESMAYFERNLNDLGINDALREKGVKEGDTVKFLEWEFEWFDY